MKNTFVTGRWVLVIFAFVAIACVASASTALAQTNIINESCVAFTAQEQTNDELVVATMVAAVEELNTDADAAKDMRKAMNSETSGKVLNRLAGHSNVVIRQAVAHNPSTLKSTLKTLSKDSFVLVRGEVGRNGNTKGNVLLKLTRDEDITVLRMVMQNPNIGGKVLHRMAIESADFDECQSEDVAFIRMDIAKNPKTQPRTLEVLSKDTNETVRLLVARNEKSTEQALMRLSGDANDRVRYEVAANKNATEIVLATLVGDAYVNVRQQVAAHKSASQTMLCLLTQDSDAATVSLAKENLYRNHNGHRCEQEEETLQPEEEGTQTQGSTG